MGRTLSLSALLKPQQITFNHSTRNSSQEKQQPSLPPGPQPSIKVVKLRHPGKRKSARDSQEVGYQPKFANQSNSATRRDTRSFRLNPAQMSQPQLLPPTAP